MRYAPLLPVRSRRLAGLVAIIAGLLVAPATATAAPNVGPAPARPSATPSPLTLVSRQTLDPRLRELTFTTPALAAPTHVRVLLPADYRAEPTRRYPVLYLLHGGFGSYVDWTTAGDAEAITAGQPLIVVMPDGGRGGWYSDWTNFGRGGPPEWETYHIDQLIPWIDAHYRTVANRCGRAIAGLSMGGFGAMSYAARHPDDFSAVASFSGAVDTNNPSVHGLITISPPIDGGSPGAIYGIPPLDEPAQHAHNPFDLAANYRGMHVALYTGNGHPGPLDGPNAAPLDVQEFFVHQMNVSLHQRLDSLGIAHTFVDYGNGTHSWPYWQRDFREELPALVATFARNGALTPAWATG